MSEPFDAKTFWSQFDKPAGQVTDHTAGDRAAVDFRKNMLRIEAIARDELAAETAPAIPRLYRGDAFLAQPDDTPPWRITGLWPAGGNVVLAAQFKAGKTTLRDNLIRSWCDGYLFLGRYPITPTAGHLVVIDAEMPARIARRWLNDQMIAHTERFSYVNIRSASASLNILAPATAAEWSRLMTGAGAVLVDCIGPVMAALGLDESKSADTGRFLAALERVLADASVPECFLIHHMGHGAERSRGASRLRDWPDAEWRLVRQDDDPSSPRYLSAFGRDVDIPESRLDYDPGNRWLALAGGSRTDARTAAARTALTELLTLQPGLSGRAIEDALSGEHGRNTIRAAVKAAVKDGEVITKSGPKGAQLHFLKPLVRQCATPTQRALCVCAPPYRGGAHAHTKNKTKCATPDRRQEVASIEEQLAREEWDPAPGEQVIGTITGMTARTSKKGDRYPVLTIKDDNGAEHIVSCALFANEVIARAPSIGERVGVKFCGPREKRDGSGTYDKYVVAFEKEAVGDIDWTAMAEARGITVQPAAAADPRDDGDWDSAEPPGDEPPF